MCILAGLGRAIYSVIIVLMVFSSSICSGAENPLSNKSYHWELEETIQVKPGERVVALIHQNGSDLSIRVTEIDVPTDTFSNIQDGPDLRVGTEIVVFENTSDQLKSYFLEISKTNLSINSEHSVELLRNVSDREFVQAQRYSQASQNWNKAISQEESLGIWKDVALDTNSSFSNYSSVYYLKALVALEKCDEAMSFISSQSITAELSSFYNYYVATVQANCLFATARFEEGVNLFKELINSEAVLDLSSLEQKSTFSEILTGYGFSIVQQSFNTSDVNAMLYGGELIEKAFVLSEGSNDYVLLGNITSALATYQAMSGDWETGLKTLFIARGLVQKTGNILPLAVVNSNIAFHYMRQGLVGDAQRIYRDVLQLLENNPEIQVQQFSITYARLALTYKTTGDYRKAESYFNIAADLYQSIEDKQGFLDTQLELGELYRLQGLTQEAVELHLELIPLIERESWNDGWVRLRIQLAKDYIENGENSLARGYVDELLAYRKSKLELNEEPSRVPAINLALSSVSANLDILMNQWEKAESELKMSLDTLNDPLQESEQQLEMIHLLSVAQYQSGQLQEAIITGRRALSLIDSVRDQVDIRRQGAIWNNRVSYISNHFISMLLKEYLATNNENYFVEAFDTLQRTKAISLRQSQLLSLYRDKSDESRIELQELWEAMIRDKQVLLASSVQNQTAESIETKALRSEEAYKAYQINPLPNDLPPLSFVTLRQVKENLLDDNTAVLTFVLNEEEGYAIEITESDHRVFMLPGTQALSKVIQSSLLELNSLDGVEDLTDLLELSDLLLSGLNENSENIIIEAGGILDQIPFSALPEVARNTYIPVGLSKVFFNVPSLSAYFEDPRDQVTFPERVQVAIIADPEFSVSEAPFDLKSAEVESFEQWRNSLGRLPYTAIEAERIINNFSENSTRAFMGDEATLENLFSAEVRHSKIIHLASHGFSSDENPNHVGFLLASNPDNPLSGFLTVENLGNYYFNSDLIVISGCETASGEVLAGEGMMGLSRAFLAQGGKSVLATLWPVSDRATALFMEYFYEALITDQLSTKDALQQAQKKMLASSRYNNPIYWAPFVLTINNQSATPL